MYKVWKKSSFGKVANKFLCVLTPSPWESLDYYNMLQLKGPKFLLARETLN